jgi:hypothetical protein
MNNLATVLRDQGKYGEAEQIYLQTLAMCESLLGKRHPDRLTSINYGQAEEMHRQVLGAEGDGAE